MNNSLRLHIKQCSSAIIKMADTVGGNGYKSSPSKSSRTKIQNTGFTNSLATTNQQCMGSIYVQQQQ